MGAVAECRCLPSAVRDATSSQQQSFAERLDRADFLSASGIAAPERADKRGLGRLIGGARHHAGRWRIGPAGTRRLGKRARTRRVRHSRAAQVGVTSRRRAHRLARADQAEVVADIASAPGPRVALVEGSADDLAHSTELCAGPRPGFVEAGLVVRTLSSGDEPVPYRRSHRTPSRQ